MTDVQIQIGTQGDVAGLKKLEDGYRSLIENSKRAYREAERERRTAMGSYRDEIGRLRDTSTNAIMPGGGITHPFGGAPSGGIPGAGIGRRVIGKAMQYGSAGAGMLGAYSLISSIMGETGGVDARNLAYATSLSAARGRGGGIDYGPDKPFFELQQMLDELGQTAFMTSKEMVPLLDVAKELGDFSKLATTPIAGAANIGKSLGVDPAVLASLLKEGLQKGGFEKGGQYVEISKMMMLNQNMMHRAAESLQSLQTVMSSTTHGVAGLSGFGIFNLLDTLNASQNKAYWGAGGAQAALRVDQAFRGGGTDDAFQYMQTLAMNPSFQASNRRRTEAAMGVRKGETNWESGYYDQLIADLSQSLGAFATPEDIIKNMEGMGIAGGGAYIKKMFGGERGGMKKMNIQRLFDVYGTTYGSEQSSGNKFLMQMQMAKSMGVSPADIGVISEAVKDKGFMERAKGGKLRTGEYAEAYRAYEEGGQKGYEKWFQLRSENQETMISIASSIRTTIDDMKEIMNEYLKPLAEITKEYLPEMAKVLINWIGTDEQKQNLRLSEEDKMLRGMGIDPKRPGFKRTRRTSIHEKLGITREAAMEFGDPGTGTYADPTETPEWLAVPGRKFRNTDQMFTSVMTSLMPNITGGGISSEFINGVAEKIGNMIVDAIRENKQPVVLEKGQTILP